MKVLIGTKNEAKIEGAKRALERYFEEVEIEGIKVESDVADQPVNQEIYEGAKNRVRNLKEFAKKNKIEADLFLGIESGIQMALGEWMITNVAVIENKTNYQSCGTSPSFPVPEKYVKPIIRTNLKEVMNEVFGKEEERHNHGGGIKILTKGQVSRIDLTEQAFIMALTCHINGEKWR